ncbi:MAG: FprA family A-type flavoprotein [Bacilli bacterium]
MIEQITDNLLMFHEIKWEQKLFEGEIPLNQGMSYNSYLLLDNKTCLLDTAAKEVNDEFLIDLAQGLKGRPLDYLVIHHLEPDHTSGVIDVIKKYPQIEIFISTMGLTLFKNFFPHLTEVKFHIIKEGDELNLGQHTLQFIEAPMVHWPEVMMSYEKMTHSLFSADAFGSFVTSHQVYEVNCQDKKYSLDETRRYYANIISKYGFNVSNVLRKIKPLQIDRILSLHGQVHEDDINEMINYYEKWSHYQAEQEGVLILYATIYGHTEKAALYLLDQLKKKQIPVACSSLNLTDVSYALSETFIYSKIILLSPTFNTGLYPKMENYLRMLQEHNLQNKKFYLVENGSWAPQAKSVMTKMIHELKNCQISDLSLTIRSSLKESDYPLLDAIVNEI